MTMQPLHKFLVVSQQSWNATQEVQFRPSVLLRLSVWNHMQLRVGLAMPDYGREAALFFYQKMSPYLTLGRFATYLYHYHNHYH